MSLSLVLLFACLVLGVLLRKTGRLPANTPQVLNAYVIWLSFPAVVLLQIPKLLDRTVLGPELLIPISMPWLHFGLAVLILESLGKILGWSRTETGAVVMTAGLGNTSFVGFPLLDSILGPDAIPIGVLVDQPGSFLVLSTAGLVYGSLMTSKAGREVKASDVAWRVASFPPFIALLAALVLWFAGAPRSEIVDGVLEKIAGTLVPLALVAVGYQLKFSAPILKSRWTKLSLGLGFKLILAPLVFLMFYVFLLGSRSFATHVTVLEAAMAPMITAAVVAEDFGFDAEICGLMLGLGIPISLFTVPLWERAISRFF